MENVASLDALVRARAAPIGETEEEVRIDLAACYRLIALYGMADLVSNHISVRVPGRHDHFFLNPYGMLYEEITASSLHKVDLDGNIVERGDPHYSVNTAGFIIHSAVHATRHDVACVLHTHTRPGVAVSCLKEGLLPLCQTALQVHDDLAYHDFEGPATSEDERERLAADLGAKNCMIMRNHGLLTCGRTVAEAFILMFQLNSACQIQIDALSMGRPINDVPPAAMAMQREIMPKFRVNPRGNFEWPALRRRLDRLLPGYEK